MGSFNVGCGISNLSIEEGDKIGFVLLGDNSMKEYSATLRSYTKDRLPSMYSYNTDVYMPKLPPIFGVYGDYGNIEEIQESATTKVIEAMYQRPVGKVIEAITCNREVYSSYGKIYENYFPKDQFPQFDPYSGAISDQLVSLGFQKIAGMLENDEVDAISDFYVFREYALRNKKNAWSIIDLTDKQKFVRAIHSPSNVGDLLDEFGAATGVYPGFAPEEYSIISKLLQTGGMFILQNVFTSMQEYRKSPDSYTTDYFSLKSARSEDDWDEFMEILKKIAIGEPDDYGQPFSFYSEPCHLNSKEYLKTHVALEEKEYVHLYAYAGTDEFDLVSDLIEIMYSTNRMFLPSYNGEQFGDTEASLALVKASENILKERKRLSNMDNGDWDDDF